MKLFNLNSKIELITKDDVRTSGLIHDIIENKIYVSVPPDDRGFKILRIGDSIRGFIYENDKLTCFDATITNRISGDVPIYEVSNINNFSKIQRRQDVRVLCTIPILYTDNKYLININTDTEDVNKVILNLNKFLKNGMTSDLSAGGLRFSCSNNLQLGSMLLLIFKLKDDYFITKVMIVYKELNSSPKETIYTYGIKYIDINEKKREKIINYNFVMMRKNKLK